MPAHRTLPADHTYALRLRAPADPAGAVRGRIEHVVSGRCRDFESASGLLHALIDLQDNGVDPMGGSASAGDPLERQQTT